ncbi:MAG: AAA family ATPase [Firmicutes bacterium]|nr:AAA family ATPase [Bacillota bacterium]
MVPAVTGREYPWQWLAESMHQRMKSLTYLWGPPGSGKTWLLQHFSDVLRERDVPQVWSDGRSLEGSIGSWCVHLAQWLGLPSTTEGASQELIGRAMMDRAKRQPFFWVIDDFDAMGALHDWLLDLSLHLSRLGCGVILTGRVSPAHLWAGRSYARSHIQNVALQDFSVDDTQALLAEQGITDPALVERVWRISHGRPQLLAAILDGLSLLKESSPPFESWAFFHQPIDLTGFLLEQMFHPGSRRSQWRAGHTRESLDTLIAAASLVPMVNRAWMVRVVGAELVNPYWEQFTHLPILETYHGGYYGIFPYLRREIARTARAVRPWMWEEWTRRASAYYLSLVRTERIAPQHAWNVVAELVRPRLGNHPFAHRDLSPYRMEKLPPLDEEVQEFVLWRDREKVARVTTHDAPHGWVISLDAGWRDDEENGAALLGFLAQDFYRYPRIIWRGPEPGTRLARWLALLQFVPDREHPSQWTLDLCDQPYVSWLEKVVSPPHCPALTNPINMVQQVLTAIREGSDDYGPEVQAYWQQLSEASTFRTWFIDALNSADLGDRLEGKTVLVLYYLERRGTHEELAELLHVSRATYFRNHRSALERLAEAVFPQPAPLAP